MADFHDALQLPYQCGQIGDGKGIWGWHTGGLTQRVPDALIPGGAEAELVNDGVDQPFQVFYLPVGEWRWLRG